MALDESDEQCVLFAILPILFDFNLAIYYLE